MLKKFGESETCTSCGACVCQLPDRRVLRQGGGLPWPARQLSDGVDHPAPNAPLGCGLKVFTKLEKPHRECLGDPDSPVNRGHLCVKGRYETWAERANASPSRCSAARTANCSRHLGQRHRRHPQSRQGRQKNGEGVARRTAGDQ